MSKFRPIFRSVAVLASLAIWGISAWPAHAQVEAPCAGDRGSLARAVIVPSATYPTIQAGLCAVDDHGTIFLSEGTYRERVRIRGKHVNISGRGQTDKPQRWPEWRAPTPPEFVHAERAEGTITLEDGGSLSVQRIRFIGGDAQILVGADAGPLKVTHTEFAGGWRGILRLSPGSLDVRHAVFRGQQHSGISYNPDFSGFASLACTKDVFVNQSSFQAQSYVAVLIKNCASENISNADALIMGLAVLNIEGSGAAGILLVNSGPFQFEGITIEHATGFGIAAVGSSLNLINSTIQHTHPNSGGKFGDGITMWPNGDYPSGQPSNLFLSNVQITDSARVGLSNFGSFVSLGNVQISCAAVEMEGEPLDGFDYAFENRGGNLCGCPTGEPAGPLGSCAVETVGLEAPEPIGIE